MALISIEDYCEINNVEYQTIYMSIYKIHPTPSWAIKKGKTYYIDTITISSPERLEKAAWLFSTDKLYWWLTDWMKLSHSKLSDMLSARSKKFKSKQSWNTYLSCDLFNIPSQTMYSHKKTMTQEFVIIGTALVLAYYRDNY